METWTKDIVSRHVLIYVNINLKQYKWRTDFKGVFKYYYSIHHQFKQKIPPFMIFKINRQLA